jgi:uncharacterized protein
MDIWLDITPVDQPAMSDDCDDCDVECSKHDRGLYGRSLMERDICEQLSCTSATNDLYNTKAFQQVAPLYMQSLARDRTLVCHPTGSGQIAVLDAEAVALLDRFRRPTALSAILEESPEFTPQQIAKAVTLFDRSGFLHDVRQPSFTPRQNESDTLSAWIHITNACNLRCSYCYLHKTAEPMSDDTGQRAIDAIFRSARRNHYRRVRLRYAGGEASLRATQMLALHEYATELAQRYEIDLYAFILSNGVYLSPRTIKQFKEHHIGVTISLDGIGEYHDSQRPFLNGRGSFQYVERTIQRLLEHELVPFISVTVSRRNLVGLPELMQYILERQMPFSLNYYRDNECSSHIEDLQYANEEMITGMRDAFAVIERQLPRRRLLGSLLDKASLQTPHHRTCGVGQNYMVIDQDGKIAKCHADITHTVATIDADDPLQLVRNDKKGVQGYSVEQKEGCRSCTWRHWCTGGCPLLTYRMTGRYDIKSPNCSIYQALFPDVLRLEGLRLLAYATPISI